MPAAGASAFFSAMLNYLGGIRYVRSAFKADEINGIDETNGAYGA
jgi:hypothetical protein